MTGTTVDRFVRDTALILEKRGVEADLAGTLAREAAGRFDADRGDPERLWGSLVARIAARIRGVGGDGPGSSSARVIALVGPAGGGKTTTAAKLAARFMLCDRQRVALITADSYRIGAAGQLRRYGEIMGLPVDVVTNAEDWCAAVEEHGSADRIILDTPGYGPRDGERLAELRSLLSARRPDEIHLVLNVSMHHADINAAIDRFRPIGFNRVLLTHLDETIVPGQVLSVLSREGVPVSYVANGQEVPEDLHAVGSGSFLAQAIAGESHLLTDAT